MMNSTSYKAFFFGVASALAIGAAFAQHTEAAQAPKAVVQLERVIIEGKKLQTNEQVAQLPRVVIEGRSQVSGVQLAVAKQSCAPHTMC